METLAIVMAPICLFAIWRAEVIDERKRIDEKIQKDRELNLRKEELEFMQYISECYDGINKKSRLGTAIPSATK